MSWIDKYSDVFDRPAGGVSKWCNLKDGDSITFWLPDQSIGCEESWWANNAKVAHDAPGAQLSQKVVISVYDVNAKHMRILRLTPPTFDRLAKSIAKGGTDRAYTVSRSRVAGRVSYHVEREDRIAPEMLERYAREPVIDVLDQDGVFPLEELRKPPAGGKAAPAATPDVFEREPRPARQAPSRARPGAAAQPHVTRPDDDIPF